MKSTNKKQLPKPFGLHLISVVALLIIATGYLGYTANLFGAHATLMPEITLTHPSFPADSEGADRWVLVDDTLQIRWSLSEYDWIGSAGYDDYTVTIKYDRHDETKSYEDSEVTIAENIPAESFAGSRLGSYEWRMPPSAASYKDLMNPDDRQIAVYLMWNGDPYISISVDDDKSLRFSILPYYLVAPDGDTWTMGDTEMIRWSTHLRGPANIYLWTRRADGTTSHSPIARINHLEDQLYEWEVGFNSRGGEFTFITDPDVTNYIYLVPLNYDLTSGWYKGWDEDDLDSQFAIYEPFVVVEVESESYPLITVISPTLGDRWDAGTLQTIWFGTATQIETVDIFYSADGGTTYARIADDIVNSGQYAWTPDLNQVSDLARIKVTDGVDNNIYGESDLFVVVAQEVGPSIIVTSPEMGDMLYWNTTYDIEFETTGITGPVSITLVNALIGEYVIAPNFNIDADGIHAYSWTPDPDDFSCGFGVGLLNIIVATPGLVSTSGQFDLDSLLRFVSLNNETGVDGTCSGGVIPEPPVFQSKNILDIRVGAPQADFDTIFPTDDFYTALYYRVLGGAWQEVFVESYESGDGFIGFDSVGGENIFSYDWLLPVTQDDLTMELLTVFDETANIDPDNPGYFARTYPITVTGIDATEISIQSPTTGTEWEVLYPQTIEYTTTSVAVADIYYSVDGGTNYSLIGVQNIDDLGTHANTYTWTPTTDHISDTARIKIVAGLEPEVFVESEIFLIGSPVSVAEGVYVSAVLPLAPTSSNDVLASLDRFESVFHRGGGETDYVQFMIQFLNESGQFVYDSSLSTDYDMETNYGTEGGSGSFYYINVNDEDSGYSWDRFTGEWLSEVTSIKLGVRVITADYITNAPSVTSMSLLYTLGTGGPTPPPGETIDVNLILDIPFEGSLYNYTYATNPSRVWVIVVKQGDKSNVPINARYTLRSDGDIHLLNTQLTATTDYDVWAKGSQHLAVADEFHSPGEAAVAIGNNTLVIPFEDSVAYIGDTIHPEDGLDPYRQTTFNKIDSLDYYKFLDEYMLVGLDLLSDFVPDSNNRVDSVDWSRFLPNWIREGALYPL